MMNGCRRFEPGQADCRPQGHRDLVIMLATRSIAASAGTPPTEDALVGTSQGLPDDGSAG
jgi:hypothetical protein